MRFCCRAQALEEPIGTPMTLSIATTVVQSTVASGPIRSREYRAAAALLPLWRAEKPATAARSRADLRTARQASRPDHRGTPRRHNVDELRARLLRDRDDANVDAALRRRAFRFRPAQMRTSGRYAAPINNVGHIRRAARSGVFACA